MIKRVFEALGAISEPLGFPNSNKIFQSYNAH